MVKTHVIDRITYSTVTEPVKTINSKAEYFALARKGLLGNQIRQWTLEQFRTALRDNPGSVPGSVAVRGTTPASKEYQGYNLTTTQAISLCEQAAAKGFQLFIDEQAPDDRCVLKGEVMCDEYSLYMRYDQTPGLRMREAFDIMKHTKGLRALVTLKHYMDASSWDTLCRLLEEYPDSMIEFSVYDHCLGTENRNTIFWEVRNY